jgi:hypothetical protein
MLHGVLTQLRYKFNSSVSAWNIGASYSQLQSDMYLVNCRINYDGLRSKLEKVLQPQQTFTQYLHKIKLNSLFYFCSNSIPFLFFFFCLSSKNSTLSHPLLNSQTH